MHAQKHNLRERVGDTIIRPQKKSQIKASFQHPMNLLEDRAGGGVEETQEVQQ